MARLFIGTIISNHVQIKEINNVLLQKLQTSTDF
jgi:hypothetical protein